MVNAFQISATASRNESDGSSKLQGETSLAQDNVKSKLSLPAGLASEGSDKPEGGLFVA